MKSRLGLSGDVYLYNNHFIENLESHKKLILNSKAKDINEAFVERVQYEVEQEKLQAEQAKENQREIEELQ